MSLLRVEPVDSSSSHTEHGVGTQGIFAKQVKAHGNNPRRSEDSAGLLGPKEFGFLAYTSETNRRGLVTHHSLLADQVHCGSLQSTALPHPHTLHLQARECAWSGDPAVSAFVLL